MTERVINPETRVTVHSDTEEISDSSKGAAGNVTVASNLPDGDANGTDGQESARTETRERVNYDYSEVKRETVRQAGAIRRISVAVLVDGIVTRDDAGEIAWTARTPEELEALRQLVIAAIGYDETRGDIVTVDSMAFQPDATPGELVEAGPFTRFVERNAMTLIQLAFLAVVAVVLAMTVIRPIVRSRAVAPALPAGLARPGEVGADDGLQLLGAGGEIDGMPGELGEIGELGALPDLDFEPVDVPPHEALRAAVAERPEEAIATLRDWLENDEVPQEMAA